MIRGIIGANDKRRRNEILVYAVGVVVIVVVADITSYDSEDITFILDALGTFNQYIMISSSAVYPEYGMQPFKETSELAVNKFWGTYGKDKIAAEKELLSRVPDAYILRPPYLYGPMNNVYRESV